ncbi:MAG: RNA-binding protein [Proteobacteria bacterium]|nr:MAG: RNA-binding protein [Pseudomonadota bacterium]
MNIYVGNLAYATTEDDLRGIFSAFGDVSKVSIIKDRETGRSKGFGFVEMSDDTAAQAAINGLNDTEIGGRNVKVNEAKPRENNGASRPPRRDSGHNNRQNR